MVNEWSMAAEVEDWRGLQSCIRATFVCCGSDEKSVSIRAQMSGLLKGGGDGGREEVCERSLIELFHSSSFVRLPSNMMVVRCAVMMAEFERNSNGRN